jgi:hypothetical protein
MPVHDLGRYRCNLVLSYATCIHWHCSVSTAVALIHSAHRVVLDYRPDWVVAVNPGWPIVCKACGDDVAKSVRQQAQPPLNAIGYPTKCAGLLIAAKRNYPLLWVSIAFEPIILPPLTDGASPIDPGSSPLVQGARRHRAELAPVNGAMANFSTKPPIDASTLEAVRLSLDQGVRRKPDESEGGAVPCCTGGRKSRKYIDGAPLTTFGVLAEIPGRITMVGRPSAITPQIKERWLKSKNIPKDACHLVAPQVVPEQISALIAAHLHVSGASL